MTVTELNTDQMIQVKQHYMVELADCGEFAEVMGVGYDEPIYGDLASADELIPDEVIYDHYRDIEFVEEDFWL